MPEGATPLDREAHDDRIFRAPSFCASSLPDGADAYLRAGNPRLVELERLYAAFHEPVVDHSLWGRQFQQDTIDLRYFRGDNGFLWQYRGYRDREVVRLTYLVTAYYLEKIDRLGLLQRLGEDGLFGAYTFDFNGRPVSRDLLDSVSEIYFLLRNLGDDGLGGARVLDIGAGYGRLAHRMTAAIPALAGYDCVDAVPVSSFLCEYYLGFRGLAGKARMVPLPELAAADARGRWDLAVNVHSFSECALAAIAWWLDFLVRSRVRHLMIVPNDGRALRSTEKDGSHPEYAHLLAERGYEAVTVEPQYLDPSAQEVGVHAGCHHLYRLAV